ncbi:Cuticle protein 16.8, partial [Sarcoptes scabiei]
IFVRRWMFPSMMLILFGWTWYPCEARFLFTNPFIQNYEIPVQQQKSAINFYTIDAKSDPGTVFDPTVIHIQPLSTPLVYNNHQPFIQTLEQSNQAVTNGFSFFKQPDELGAYHWGYKWLDEQGNQMFREESSDGRGTVTGRYSFRDSNGIIRIVEYVADENGFRTRIRTNEPGMVSMNSANAEIIKFEDENNIPS